ncbi:MAG: hypothetical protein M0Q01_13225 [Syntrophales bacterium]|jgi:hypothetical protein|nr:hypothetical protein [Syntrophales bacterium]
MFLERREALIKEFETLKGMIFAPSRRRSCLPRARNEKSGQSSTEAFTSAMNLLLHYRNLPYNSIFFVNNQLNVFPVRGSFAAFVLERRQRIFYDSILNRALVFMTHPAHFLL